MKLVIDRLKWLRGEGSHDSALLRSTDGKMCCLGFYGLACGLTPEDLKDVKVPHKIKKIDAYPEWLRQNTPDGGVEASQSCSQLMAINDEPIARGEPCREEFLAEVFAKHGVEVEFIN